MSRYFPKKTVRRPGWRARINDNDRGGQHATGRASFIIHNCTDNRENV